MTRTSVRLAVCLLLICCTLPLMAQRAASDSVVPTNVKFTGALNDINGKPLTGTVGVTFLLYKEQTGGAPLWMETQNVQADKNGRYSVMLGSATSHGLPAEAFAVGEARWLGVQPSGQAEQPRVALASVPYALKAADAQTLNGLPASAFVLAAPQATAAVGSATQNSAANSTSSTPLASSNVTTTGGTVNALPLWTTATNIQNSILTQTATTAVNVGGKLNLPATGTATATIGFNSRPETMVASVFNSGTGTAVAQTFQLQAEPAKNNTTTASGTLNLLYGSGTVPPTETGFKIDNKGLITFATGQTFPGTGTGTVKSVGLSAPSSDFTVTGSPVTSTGTLGLNWKVPPTSANVANAIVKRDVFGGFAAGAISATVSSGTALSATGDNGVFGSSTNSSGNGVYGSNLNHTGVYGDGVVGVWGHSSTNVGVFGASFGTDAFSDGVQGVTTSGSASGVLGVNNAGGVGVYGAGGTGVYATSASGQALAAITKPTTTADTLVAINNGGGFPFFAGGTVGGVYIDAAGDLVATGSINGSVKNFRIDHPLDPANKYLSHASVESSEMMNIYTGNVTTDAQGNAVVRLPDWFETLNRDFRYQLTSVGQFSQAIISREIANRQFSIQTDKPNVKVSWQVTGIRQDAWANAHPISVEQLKLESERGLYLHPELFGASAEKGIAQARHPEMQKLAK